MNDKSTPFVSVVIPVFNDSERLKFCLEALENQTYLKSLYDVIVVDNGSDEDVEGVVSQFHKVFYTNESRPGPPAARNKGISLSKGEVIAFTDSDCIPSKDWIEKGVRNLLNVPNCGLVGGKVEVFFKDPDAPTTVELYDSLWTFRQRLFIEEHKYSATLNLFTLQHIFDEVGFFDDRLLAAYEDVEWGQRVFSAGYDQVYADDVYVAHPARYSFSQMYKKFVRDACGAYDLKRINNYSLQGGDRDFFSNLMSPISVTRVCSDIISITRACSDNGLNWIRKIKVIFVMFFGKFVTVWERLRLQLGRESKYERV